MTLVFVVLQMKFGYLGENALRWYSEVKVARKFDHAPPEVRKPLAGHIVRDHEEAAPGLQDT